MKFSVSTGPSLTRNALLNRSNKDAAYRQTDFEHDNLLNAFVETNMEPWQEKLALLRGKQAEEGNPRYWDDEEPRKPLTPSSSFIEDIEYLPTLNLARIRIGGKIYDFPGFTPKQMGDMITSDSLGGYLWDNDRWLTKHRK